MVLQLIKLLFYTLILLVTQSLVLNHIHFLGYATPIIYIYIILKLPRYTTRWQSLLIGFFVGLCADSFTNTLGVSTIATTALAMFAPLLLNLFVDADNTDDFTPGYDSMGVSAFFRYVLFCVLFHHLIMFFVEAFTFIEWGGVFVGVLASTALTTAVIMAVESAISSRR